MKEFPIKELINQEITDQLRQLKQKLEEQNLLKKDILNFKETCIYLDQSSSHLYKLTSQKRIPHYCPQGKRLIFKRTELDEWLLRNRIETQNETEKKAADYLVKKGKFKL